MNKNMALISSCLLLFSTQLLANRPAMDEANAGAEMLEPVAESEPEITGSASPFSEITETELNPTTSDSNKQEESAEKAMAPTEMAPAEPIPYDEPVPYDVITTTEPARQQTGDVLELQSGETLPVHTLDFPKRGTSMDNVQKELGEPLTISPAIGDPPITTWSYNDRTIYFEHSRVIHAVPNR